MFGECHAHIFMNGQNYREAVEQHKGHINQEQIRRWFQEYQKKGISFIRDGGDALGVSACAKNLAPEYGITYRTPIFAIHKKGHYGSIVGHGFENMQEYHELVKKVRREKGDFIKLMVSGIMDFDRFGVITGTPLKREEIGEMIHIAHEEGYSVMVHANTTEAVRSAVLAGADSIEHGNYLDDDCIAAMAEEQTVWVPTLATIRNLMGCGRYPEEEITKIARAAEENVKKAWESGVQLALGSDAGAYLVPHGEGIQDEYRIFQEILGDTEALQIHLQAGEQKIREKF